MNNGKDWKKVSQVVGRSRSDVSMHGAFLRQKFMANPMAKRAYLLGILNIPIEKGGRLKNPGVEPAIAAVLRGW